MTDDRKLLSEFWDTLDDSPFVMLGIPSQNAHSEPMTAFFDSDNPGSIWFFTGRDNRAVQGLVKDSAMIQFAGKGHDFFACVRGDLLIEPDKSRIDQFWSNSVAAWFEGGRDDPNLVMLRFDPRDAEMWKADLSITGKLKMVFGGTIDREEARENHAEVAL